MLSGADSRGYISSRKGLHSGYLLDFNQHLNFVTHIDNRNLEWYVRFDTYNSIRRYDRGLLVKWPWSGVNGCSAAVPV